MSAPVSEQVKAEAARSLLERMSEKTKLVRFFRYNASAKHGVPIDSDTDVNITIPESQDKSQNETVTKTETNTQKEKEVLQPIVIEKKDGDGDQLWGILKTLGAVGALAAAVWGGSMLAGTKDAPKDTQSTEKPYYSPLQFLEDTGEHLP